MIPPRLRLRGDLDKARRLADVGRDELRILHRLMDFQGLKQCKRKISFADGTTINTSSVHGSDVIVIEVPIVTVEEVEYPEEEIVIIEAQPRGAASRTLAGQPSVIVIDDECCPSINKVGIIGPDSMPTETIENVEATSGCPPYNWSIVGTDFHLLDGVDGTGENGEFNRVYLGGSGAGQGYVSAFDDCEDEAILEVDCSNCGYWAPHEEGESSLSGAPPPECSDCYTGPAEDEGEHNDCYRNILERTCYSADGKEKWIMSYPACYFAGEAACPCTCWGDWKKYHPGYPEHGDPSEHPPNCEGADNTPCGLNPGDCDICTYDGFDYECMSCVLRHYERRYWVDT